MNISAKHPEILLKEFDNEMDVWKEQGRVMQERSNLCFKKIKEVEAEEAKLINNLREDDNKFNYEKARSDVEQLLKLKENIELPSTNILYSIINHHSANISQGMAPEARLSSGKVLFKYRQKIFNILTVRRETLNLEIKDIKTALSEGLAMEYLAKMNQEEITLHALDREFQGMNSEVDKYINDLQGEILATIRSLEDAVTKFEKNHPVVRTAVEKSEYAKQVFSRITEYVAIVSDAIVLLIDFLPFGGVMRGVVDVALDIFYKAASSADLTVTIMERSKELNQRMIEGIKALENEVPV
jgi:hypothetical protein